MSYHCSYKQYVMEINAAAKFELNLILYVQGDRWGTANIIRIENMLSEKYA